MDNAFYSNTISAFCESNHDDIWGTIAQNSRLDDNTLQKDSWSHEITSLKTSLIGLSGEIFFEYSIPRLGKRADVIIVTKGIVLVLEYKVGSHSYDRPDLEQVWDYALDLKYFHEKSHDLWIAPILIATKASEKSQSFTRSCYDDKVLEPICCNDYNLRTLIDQIIVNYGSDIFIDSWKNSRYNPTPTIIEAATVLYRRKNLKNKAIADITRTDATGQSLQKTTDAVLRIIEESRNNGQKSICFVTGVPGAGKTLVGLNIAINLFEASKETGCDMDRSLAVYLSGNGPLVRVLREALARDAVEQEKRKNPKTKYNKTLAHKAVDSFIMDVYHHRDYVMQMVKRPIPEGAHNLEVNSNVSTNDGADWLAEHVDIFDEAQRSWTYDQLKNWLARKKGIANFPMSEPEFLTWGLDKKKDWAVIICLVGGGQEINTGEAGISTWISAIQDSFDNWHIYYPENLKEKEYADGKVEEMIKEYPADKKHALNDLHLSVSMRSFRAENLSKFVKSVLDVDIDFAKRQLETLNRNYPIRITRDLGQAKIWLRNKARGSERYGLLVSSQAYRLRPLSIDVRCKPDTVHWFLDDISDIRSSMFLEDVATEFDVQGLELDWAGIVWDGDMVYDPQHLILREKDRKKKELIQDSWTHRSFNGNTWQNIASDMRRMYQINAYRVLLTRARQGMIICVPQGNDSRNIDGKWQDPTRISAFYDSTYHYLHDMIGIIDIEDE
ncbi:MAG: DNA/RNA helicase domain-containing protein [Candidatus Cryptobacteroides sp.]